MNHFEPIIHPYFTLRVNTLDSLTVGKHISFRREQNERT